MSFPSFLATPGSGQRREAMPAGDVRAEFWQSPLPVWRARLAMATAAFVFLIACVMMVGAVYEVDVFAWVPDHEPGAASVAIIVAMTGAALVGLAVFRRDERFWFRPVAAWGVVALAGLWQFSAGVLGGGMQIPFWDTKDATMPPLLAAGFAVGGGAISATLCSRSLMRWWSAWIALGVVGLGLLLLLGYAYGLPFLYDLPFRPAGFGAALGILAAGVSLAASVGFDESPLRLVSQSSAAGRLVRTFVPMVAISIVVYDLTRQAARNQLNLHPVVLDFAVMVGMVALVGYIVARTARRLGREIDRAQKEKARAESRLRVLNRDLEVRVAERTEKLTRVNRELRESLEKVDDVERERVEVAAREHKRIGEYLHDSIGQLLTGIGYISRGLEQRLNEREAPEAETASEICRLAAQVISETRHISRGFFAVSLESHGLCYALAELTDFIRQTYGVECRFIEPKAFPSLDSRAATNLYRIAQEGINNAIKHGDATEIEISFSVSESACEMRVWNNGHPFIPSETDGIGLQIMDQRTSEIAGQLSICTKESGVELTCGFPI